MKREFISKLLYKAAQNILEGGSFRLKDYRLAKHLKKIKLPIYIEKVGSFVFAYLPESFLRALKFNLMDDIQEAYDELKSYYLTDYLREKEKEKVAEVLDSLCKPREEQFSFINVVGICYDYLPKTILEIPITDLFMEKDGNIVYIQSEKIAQFINKNNIYSPSESVCSALYDSETINKIATAKSFVNLITELSKISAVDKKKVFKLLKESAAVAVPVPNGIPVPVRAVPVNPPQTDDSDLSDFLRFAAGAAQQVGLMAGFFRRGSPIVEMEVYRKLYEHLRKNSPGVLEAELTTLRNLVKNSFGIFGLQPPAAIQNMLEKGFENPMVLMFYRMLAGMLGIQTPLTIMSTIASAVTDWVMRTSDVANIPTEELAERIAVISGKAAAELRPILERFRFAKLPLENLVSGILLLLQEYPHLMPVTTNLTDLDKEAERFKKIFLEFTPLMLAATHIGIDPQSLAKYIRDNGLNSINPTDLAVSLLRFVGIGAPGADFTVTSLIANSASFKLLAAILKHVRSNPDALNDPMIKRVVATYSNMDRGIPYIPLSYLTAAASRIYGRKGVHEIITGSVSAGDAILASGLLPKMSHLALTEILSLSSPHAKRYYYPIMKLFNEIVRDPELSRMVRSSPSNIQKALIEAAKKTNISPLVANRIMALMNQTAQQLGVTPERLLSSFLLPALLPNLSPRKVLESVVARSLGFPDYGPFANVFYTLASDKPADLGSVILSALGLASPSGRAELGTAQEFVDMLEHVNDAFSRGIPKLDDYTNTIYSVPGILGSKRYW